jgi:1-aminocyclopropane-1-carboxylate deaminase
MTFDADFISIFCWRYSRLVDGGLNIGIRKSWEDAIQSVKDAGGKSYPIPAGVSVHALGGLGYVGFAEEVARQEKELASPSTTSSSAS